MEDRLAAYESHWMWTIHPHYEINDKGERVRWTHDTYTCSGCGYDAATVTERHIHILEKVEDSHLKTVLARSNWANLSYNE